MPKQAHVSISNLALEAMGIPDFEQLKVGATGENAGFEYEIVGGIPPTAKLDHVIYVFSDESLPDVDNPLAQPSITIRSLATPKPCPMCPMEIRNLSAVVHNLIWRLEPGSGVSYCKLLGKFYDMKRAVEHCPSPAEDAPEPIKLLYSVAREAAESKTIEDLRKFLPRLKEASTAVEVLSDAHFADRSHSHGSI